MSKDLTNKLRDAIQAPDDGDLRRALGLIIGSIAFRQGADGYPINGSVDIEKVLQIAYMLEHRMVNPLSGFVASWHSALESLAPNGNGVVFRALGQRARQFLSNALQTPKEPITVKYLAGLWKLGRLWQSGPTWVPPTVFTLNYDRCLETALSYEGHSYTTGFLQGVWATTEFQRNDCLRLYKLHGSFGWVRDPQNQLLYDRDQAITRSDVDFQTPETEDELIFATENKLQAIQPFLWMVHQFSEYLTSSKYIVTVGYGYADSYINQLIGQAMATDPSKRLLVVDPFMDQEGLEARGLIHYPERTVFIREGAKQALSEADTVYGHLRRLENSAREEAPFS